MPTSGIPADQLDAAVAWLLAEFEKRPSQKLGRSNPGMKLLKNSERWFWLTTVQRRGVAALAKARWETRQQAEEVTMADIRAVKARRQSAPDRGADYFVKDEINYPQRTRRDGSRKTINTRLGEHGTRYGAKSGCECLWTPDTQPLWWDHGTVIPPHALRAPKPGCEEFERRRQAALHERRFSNAATKPMAAVPRARAVQAPCVPEPRPLADPPPRSTEPGRHRKVVGRHR